MTEPDTKNLGHHVKRGVKWSGAELGFRFALRIVALAILARLLTPEDFGVFAAAMTVIELLMPLSTLALENALVQQKELSAGAVSMATIIALLFSSAFMLVTLLAAPLISLVYNDEKVTELLSVLAYSFPAAAISTLLLAVLRRRLAFAELSIIAFVGFNLASLVTIAMAYTGYGVWSLVVGYYVQILAQLLLTFRWVKPRFYKPVWSSDVKSMLRFGTGQSLSSMLSYWALQGDYVVIGRMLGTASLGFYTRAYQLVSVVPTIFARIQSTVLFPAFSRFDTRSAEFGERFVLGVEGLSVLTLPICAGAVVVAPELVETILGNGWEPVVLPLQVLSGGIFFRSAQSLAASVIMARGQVFALSICQAIYAVLIVGGALIGASVAGIAGVAASTIAALAVFYCLLTGVVLRDSAISVGELATAHLRSLLGFFIVLAASLAAKQLASYLGCSAWQTLALAIVASLLALASATLVFKTSIWGELLYTAAIDALARRKKNA